MTGIDTAIIRTRLIHFPVSFDKVSFGTASAETVSEFPAQIIELAPQLFFFDAVCVITRAAFRTIAGRLGFFEPAIPMFSADGTGIAERFPDN